MTPGCRVAGVQPGPPWNGTHPPHEKEMEQEIGLVSLFPSLVSLQQSYSCTLSLSHTHTLSHTLVHTLPKPRLIGDRPGTFCMCASGCLCLYECGGLELRPA